MVRGLGRFWTSAMTSAAPTLVRVDLGEGMDGVVKDSWIQIV
jgi:hypothetical protein